MKKLASLLALAAALSAAPAQQPTKPVVSIEIKGLNKIFTEVGVVSKMLGQEMPPEALRQMVGGALSVPNLDGVDLDGTVRLFIEEGPADGEPPPPVLALPIKGGNVIQQLGLSMDETEGPQEGEMTFKPKPGGGPQLGGIPSLASMPFVTKQVGDTLLVGENHEALRAVAGNWEALTADRNIPGLVTADFDPPGLSRAWAKGMQAQQAQQKAVLKEQIEAYEQMIKPFKKSGNDAADLEAELKRLRELQAAGAEDQVAEQMVDSMQGLLAQLDGLSVGLNAENRRFTLITLADPKPGSAIAAGVAEMRPPAPAYLQAPPADAIMAYAAHFPKADAFFAGYLDWATKMSQVGGQAATPDMDKLMAEAGKLMKGQLRGDMAMAWLPSAGDNALNMTGMMAVNDPAKFIADSKTYYENLKGLNLGNEVAGEMRMEMTPTGTREYKGHTVHGYTAKMEAEPGLAGVPNPAVGMFHNTKTEIAATKDTVLFAYGDHINGMIDQAISGETGGPQFHQAGVFGRNWPTLKKTPASMYSLDLLGYTHVVMNIAAPDMAKNIPKTGGVVTGWSNALGPRWVHADRIGYADVVQVVGAGMTAWAMMMKNMQQEFHHPPGHSTP